MQGNVEGKTKQKFVSIAYKDSHSDSRSLLITRPVKVANAAIYYKPNRPGSYFSVKCSLPLCTLVSSRKVHVLGLLLVESPPQYYAIPRWWPWQERWWLAASRISTSTFSGWKLMTIYLLDFMGQDPFCLRSTETNNSFSLFAQQVYKMWH